MTDAHAESPNADVRRWARRLSVALLVGVAMMHAARQNWLGAAIDMSYVCIVAFFTTAVVRNERKVQTRYLVVLLTALALTLWEFFARVAH